MASLRPPDLPSTSASCLLPSRLLPFRSRGPPPQGLCPFLEASSHQASVHAPVADSAACPGPAQGSATVLGPPRVGQAGPCGGRGRGRTASRSGGRRTRFLSDFPAVSTPASALCRPPGPRSLPQPCRERRPPSSRCLSSAPRCCRGPWTWTPSGASCPTSWTRCTWKCWSCGSRWLSLRSTSCQLGRKAGHIRASNSRGCWTPWPSGERWVWVPCARRPSLQPLAILGLAAEGALWVPAPVGRPHGPLVLPWWLPPGWTQCWGPAPASALQPLHGEVVRGTSVRRAVLCPPGRCPDRSPRGCKALALTPSRGSPREEPVSPCASRRRELLPVTVRPSVRVPWAPVLERARPAALVPPGSAARFGPEVCAKESAAQSAQHPVPRCDGRAAGSAQAAMEVQARPP